VTNATGRAVFNVSNVYVSCTIRKWALGGTVIGLGDKSGLVLVNGTDRVEIAPNATTFQMAPVSEDSPYGVTVLPTTGGPNCAVENGTGTMPSGNVANLVVRCTP
ncbi:MAG: 3-carboxymuconate cyclase, partial [Telluria sp.]